MLLNLARLHNHEPIYFFQLAQISAGYTFSGQLLNLGDAKTDRAQRHQSSDGGHQQWQRSHGGQTVNVSEAAQGTLGGTATHNPIFTYVPLGGDKYAQQLLTPIKPAIFYELYEEGWPIDLLMRVLIERIEVLRTRPPKGPHVCDGERSLDQRRETGLRSARRPGGELRQVPRACAVARRMQEDGNLYLDVSNYYEPVTDAFFPRRRAVLHRDGQKSGLQLCKADANKSPATCPPPPSKPAPPCPNAPPDRRAARRTTKALPTPPAAPPEGGEKPAPSAKGNYYLYNVVTETTFRL